MPESRLDLCELAGPAQLTVVAFAGFALAVMIWQRYRADTRKRPHEDTNFLLTAAGRMDAKPAREMAGELKRIAMAMERHASAAERQAKAQEASLRILEGMDEDRRIDRQVAWRLKEKLSMRAKG